MHNGHTSRHRFPKLATEIYFTSGAGLIFYRADSITTATFVKTICSRGWSLMCDFGLGIRRAGYWGLVPGAEATEKAQLETMNYAMRCLSCGSCTIHQQATNRSWEWRISDFLRFSYCWFSLRAWTHTRAIISIYRAASFNSRTVGRILIEFSMNLMLLEVT
jgi:hypothetical protein